VKNKFLKEKEYINLFQEELTSATLKERLR
jgi:hypothetical protein